MNKKIFKITAAVSAFAMSMTILSFAVFAIDDSEENRSEKIVDSEITATTGISIQATTITESQTVSTSESTTASQSAEFYFISNGDGTCTLRCFKNFNQDLVIPSKSESGDTVTKIDTKAFEGEGITSLEIPEGITEIGDYAFRNCKNLISVKLPSSLKKSGMGLFIGCTMLRSVEIPEGCALGGGEFWQCSALDNVVLPSTLTRIPAGIFQDCTALINIEIPESVTRIQKWAFKGCENLKFIRIPENVTTINEDAFYECGNAINSFDGLRHRDFTMVGAANSAAEKYAETDSGIKFLTYDEYSTLIEKYKRVDKILAYLGRSRNETNATKEAEPTTEGKYNLGDVNHNGRIDAKDATEILIFYAHSLEGDNASVPAEGDYNSDGKVDAKDATQVLVYYANSISR